MAFKSAARWLSRLAAPALLIGLPAVAPAQIVWFSPKPASPDYMSVFQDGSPWANVASRTSVVGVPAEFFLRRSDGEIQQLLADLQRRDIKLGVALMGLSGHPTQEAAQCGVGVEGYSARGEPLLIARKIRRLGGQVDFYTMDEPFFYGHRFDRYEEGDRSGRRHGCRLSADEVAADAAARIKDVKAVFPNAQVGDVEPYMEFDDQDWESELGRWFAAYRSATGEALAFFRLDLRWRSDWKSRMPRLVDLLHREGIALQVIYNGSGNAGSDSTWVREAAQRFQDFEQVAGVRPDGVVFQSWVPNPSRALPENDPNTMSGLVNTYLRWKQGQGQSVSRLP
jgi:hypothetical protein